MRRSLLSAGDYDGAELEAAIAAGYHQARPGRIAAITPSRSKKPDFRLDLEDGVVHIECKARSTRLPYDRVVNRQLKELADAVWPMLMRADGCVSTRVFCHREPCELDRTRLLDAVDRGLAKSVDEFRESGASWGGVVSRFAGLGQPSAIRA
jgi:hypothetical protein